MEETELIGRNPVSKSPQGLRTLGPGAGWPLSLLLLLQLLLADTALAETAAAATVPGTAKPQLGIFSTAAIASATQPQPMPPDVQARTLADQGGAHARLSLDGQIVLDQPGAHLGRPRISPDGRYLAVSVVPAGSETDHHAQIYVFNLADGRLLHTLAGHTPRWNDQYQEGWQAGGWEEWIRADDTHASSPPTYPSTKLSADLAYPDTIRVAHYPDNYCRNLPDWQVDTIPFDEYVARAVPAEVPASWPPEVLQAQAVAARTYAWNKIRQGAKYTPAAFGRVPYDVTDYANYQMMCDRRYPATDQAAAATAGQYLSAALSDAPISAMYSAKNGHPTLTNPNVSYLQSVPDLYSLGEARWGHGFGFSQWGGLRRALAGHSYRQILGHYYTGIHLQSALDPAQPLAGLLDNPPGGYLPLGGLRWRSLAPYTELPFRLEVDHSTGSTYLDGRSGIWYAPGAFADGAQLRATLRVAGTVQEQVTLNVDRIPPAPPLLSLPDSVEYYVITLTAQSEAGAAIGLSNGWLWEGEALDHQCGQTIQDPATANGLAWQAQAGVHTPQGTCYWYGPKTQLPAGRAYRAVFRLRAGAPVPGLGQFLPAIPIARLDVTDRDGVTVLGLRDLWLSDFAGPDTYAEIGVDFHVFDPPHGLEFRVNWLGVVDLALDTVQVWGLEPAWAEGPLSWALGPGTEVSLQAIAFDAAGNASSPIGRTVRVVDETPPVFGTTSIPAGWTNTTADLAIEVQDTGSGLDIESGGVQIDGMNFPATFSASGDPRAAQTLHASVPDLVDGVYAARFQATDLAGHRQWSPTYTLRLDTGHPTVTATVELTKALDGWVSQPVTVTLHGHDNLSGVQAMAYVLGEEDWVLYTGPFSLTTTARHALRFWAQDYAGNYSPSQWLHIGIDRTPPTVTLRLVPTDPAHATATWTVTDEHAGVAGYDVEVQWGEEVWQALEPPPGAEKSSGRVFELSAGEMLSVRTRARDIVGNQSDWTTATLNMPGHWNYLPTVGTGKR